MSNIRCPKCEKEQFSLMDRNYLILYNTCWECDKVKWERGELSLEEFDIRESKATEAAVKTF